MTRRWLNLATLVLLASLFAACDGPRNTSSRSVLAPGGQITARTDAVLSGKYILLTTDMGWEDGEVTRSMIVDQRGGKLNFLAGFLEIPANAVAAPTKFTVTFRNSPYMRAELSAVGPLGESIRTFPVPLTLTLSFARTKTYIPDPSKLQMGWIQNGVVLELEPSSVDVQGKKIKAQVTHFTDYGPIGIDGGPGDSQPADLDPVNP